MSNPMRRFVRHPLTPALALAVAVLARPDSATAQTQNGLSLEINRYYGEQDRALIEGAVEIPYPLLTFVQDGESFRAHARVEVEIDKADGGEQVYRTEHEIRPEAANPTMAASDRVSSIETFAIYAPPGRYVAKATVVDMANEKTYELTAPMVIDADRPFFSDLLLSNRVQKDVRLQEGTYLPFLIGTTMFNPNPRNVFYKDSPLLYFYYEVNPQAVEAEPGDTIALQMVIRDGAQRIIKDLGARSITVSEGRNFDLGAFNFGGLVPGSYVFEVRCEACPGGDTLATPFEVSAPLERLAFMEPDPAGPSAAAAPRWYGDLTEAQVDSVMSSIDLWLTPAQRQLIATLNTGGKVQFLNRWWESMDPDPATEVNEAKTEIERRIAYADQNFTSSQRLGRATDRGRIYLLFGPPTERVDRPVEATVGPYVIWNYSSQGHTFAFGDFRRDGDYRLIYSTEPRFPGDPSIQSQVDAEASGGRESFLLAGRGYERVIEDIRQYRTSAGFNN